MLRSLLLIRVTTTNCSSILLPSFTFSESSAAILSIAAFTEAWARLQTRSFWGKHKTCSFYPGFITSTRALVGSFPFCNRNLHHQLYLEFRSLFTLWEIFVRTRHTLSLKRPRVQSSRFLNSGSLRSMRSIKKLVTWYFSAFRSFLLT